MTTFVLKTARPFNIIKWLEDTELELDRCPSAGDLIDLDDKFYKVENVVWKSNSHTRLYLTRQYDII